MSPSDVWSSPHRPRVPKPEMNGPRRSKPAPFSEDYGKESTRNALMSLYDQFPGHMHMELGKRAWKSLIMYNGHRDAGHGRTACVIFGVGYSTATP